LHVECRVMPLALHRLALQTRFAIKVKDNFEKEDERGYIGVQWIAANREFGVFIWNTITWKRASFNQYNLLPARGVSLTMEEPTESINWRLMLVLSEIIIRKWNVLAMLRTPCSKLTCTDAYTKRSREFFGNRVSIAVKTEQFFVNHPQVPLVTQGPEWPQIPPWLAKLPNIDISPTTAVSKHEKPVLLASIANETIVESYIYRHSHHVHIYTDASRTSAGKVGIGCVFREVAAETAIWSREYSYRLTDEVSVFAGELAAIGKAFQKVLELRKAYEWRTFVLYSDSLSLFVCLLLNGTSALFRPVGPRIVEIEHTNHVKNDLK